MKLIRQTLLGVDAGLCNTGTVVFERFKNEWIPVRSFVHSTGKEHSKYVAEDNRRRIEFLADKLSEIIEKEKPRLIISELPHGGARNAKAMSAMMLAFSVVVLTCQRYNFVKLVHVAPVDLKKYVAPEERVVSKEMVIASMMNKFGPDLFPDNAKKEHIADAMACVLTYFNKCKQNGSF